jgi:hypothetical protein
MKKYLIVIEPTATGFPPSRLTFQAAFPQKDKPFPNRIATRHTSNCPREIGAAS